MRYVNTYALYVAAGGQSLAELAPLVMSGAASKYWALPAKVDDNDGHLRHAIRDGDLVIADDARIAVFTVNRQSPGLVRFETWTPVLLAKAA